MLMTASTRRLSSRLLVLASVGTLFLTGCVSVYNNKAGITPVSVAICWNTNGPLPVGYQQSAPLVPVPCYPQNVQLPQPVNSSTQQAEYGTILSTTPLGADELNATTGTPGTFSYSPGEGSFLAPGLQTITLTFTPFDTTHYKVTTFPQQIQVNDPTSAAGLASLVPEAVQIIGGGYVDGVFFHPLQNKLRYARTDVGGAYRWDDLTPSAGPPYCAPDSNNIPPYDKAQGAYTESLQCGHWTPLLDFVGRANGGDQGVEALALDPSDPKRLYLATGLNYNNDPTQQNHFYLSDDQGNTFTQVNAPFPINGNDNGRDGGERMAVDPNLGTTIYYGSRTAGMWRSLDRGQTWSQVTSFPVTGPTAGAGVIWITFVPGSGVSGTATPVIYAGVSDYNYYNADGSNSRSPTYLPVYRSVDAGATWALVPGQPTSIPNPADTPTPNTPVLPLNYNLSPIHGVVGADGVNGSTGSLYVTYFSDEGPGDSNAGAGAVFQYTPTVGSPSGPGTWTNLSQNIPRLGGDEGGYSGLALDAERPGVIMVSTMDDYNNGGDAIYRSQNYGQTWTLVAQGTAPALHDDAAGAAYGVPWLGFATPTSSKVAVGNWPSALAIDPFDSTHVEHGSGQTLWDTSGTNTGIEQSDSGHTSSVVFSVGAYGAALGGTRQVKGGQSIEETVVLGLTAPSSGAPLVSALGDLGGFVHTDLDQSPAIGAFNAPAFSTGTSVDFAQNNAQFLVRVGTGSPQYDNAYYPDPTASSPPTACYSSTQTGCLSLTTQVPLLLAYTLTQGAKLTDWVGIPTLFTAANLQSFTSTTTVSKGGGTVAVASDASTILWATYDFPPACTANLGQSWTPAVNGIIGAQVVSDRVNPGQYYQYDSVSGKLLMGVATIVPGPNSSFQCSLTFNTMATLPANSYGQLTASFGAAGDIWLAINGSSSSSGANALYHSTDSGKTLTKQGVFTAAYAVGLGAPATSSAVPIYSSPAIYVVADGASGYGFYRSIDDGATWGNVTNPSHLLGTVNQIVGDPIHFGRFYIGTSGRGIAYINSE